MDSRIPDGIHDSSCQRGGIHRALDAARGCILEIQYLIKAGIYGLSDGLDERIMQSCLLRVIQIRKGFCQKLSGKTGGCNTMVVTYRSMSVGIMKLNVQN